MISFRFHVIALTSVFVAVATGLVVGSAAWSGPESESLRDQVTAANGQNQELRERLEHLRTDADANEGFAERLAPAVLSNRLAAAKVLILATPSGKDTVDGVRRMLTTAGASITGTVEVAEAFTDPARADGLRDLATASLPPSVVGAPQPNVDGVGSASALLAAVLLKRVPPVAAQDLRSVLTAFASQGYLHGADGVTEPADAVVIVAGPPATGVASAARNSALLTMVARFDTAGAVVVASAADSGTGNVIAQVRADPVLRLTASTVDNAAVSEGRLVTAWAVAEQLAGRAGHYGTGTGATLLPKSAP